ncbi:2-oxo acid dehydrogenase subunit E2 [Streptomyces cocklensis]|jgi:pyruvate dehydrogenase E2 component (dihydrolipoamide acetyltransferase)|uniref:Dihydrolipoamide acetyltransferase component of pyruvate dehydrogenase complex n=1 Tax=Actinacidiphila cocklensis TaxID=887465 RepID=A0A9W4GUE2_9ACTN|nr:dihydrolipoamide acetyltransferase family protein [Actinacidiphila cocklensis]MDD1056917.1 2-oxo acid dehydrogenase subunit E2 [Actinacidiphila cocklensis]WSX78060.1 2-oxo acid dehydrogenase subunit E2 [Streptomyces sp. NBC_00899]CAG6398039.1 Dihydrolipoamide acetyltransferase component of pyruvate dehydrogenase complex [Actinacidiphila cocklensis]
MAVVREFTLPDLGEGLTEAEIVRWLVQVGEVVAVDQPVVEMETAKAVVEVPCPYGGVVTARFGEEGESLAVGRPLVTVAVGSAADSAHPADGDAGGDGQGSGNVLVGYGTGAAVARRRQRVRATARPAGGAGISDGAVAAPERPAAGQGAPAGSAAADADGGPVAVISPLVRRLAREHGLDLRRLAGSGPEGLILRSDVERAIAAPAPSEATDGAERVPLRGIRRAVAEKLTRSRREIPDATCWVDADATELLAARAAMNASGERRISVLALLARVVTAALARYPDLNSTVDTERSEIVRLPAVHLGFAAQTDRGLVVPVLRDAHTMTTTALAAEIARLTEAARTGSLTPAELTGGTFTLNNYGVFGVDGSTPIINHPEAAMLGVGRIAAKPWVHEGELAVREVVQLSFTFDHRVCDGGTAGGFLRLVADCVEQPAVLLAGV